MNRFRSRRIGPNLSVSLLNYRSSLVDRSPVVKLALAVSWTGPEGPARDGGLLAVVVAGRRVANSAFAVVEPPFVDVADD